MLLGVYRSLSRLPPHVRFRRFKLAQHHQHIVGRLKVVYWPVRVPPSPLNQTIRSRYERPWLPTFLLTGQASCNHRMFRYTGKCADQDETSYGFFVLDRSVAGEKFQCLTWPTLLCFINIFTLIRSATGGASSYYLHNLNLGQGRF